MTELLQPALGFVSASLVALIALGFGAMFLFFSGSALLVFGQFLPFGRRLGPAALAAIGASVLMLVIAYAAEFEPLLAVPFAQLICPALVLLFLRLGRSELSLLWSLGLSVLAGGAAALLMLTAFRILELGPSGLSVVRLAFPLLLIAGLGLRRGLALLFLVAGGLWLAAFLAPQLEPAALEALGEVLLVLLVAGLGLWPLVVVGICWHRIERPVEWFISLRYLVAKRRQTFISVITVICIFGVALGVAVITVVISVMDGFSRMWEEKIIGARAHLVVQSRAGPFSDYLVLRGEVATVPGVTGATPFLTTDAILRDPMGELVAVVLKGIDPATVAEATALEADLEEGSLADLAASPDAEGSLRLPGAILGGELADRFFLRIGDEVVLISPMGGPATPLGPAPRLLKFRVAGIFRSDFFQFDESFVFTDLPAAQNFLKLPDVVSGIEVRTRDAYRSQSVGEAIERAIGPPFYTRDWKTFFPGFFQALRTERVMMFVLLSFIMVVAGFIIISTLIMMIMEKSRDIAILKTMGCNDDGVLRIFAIQGVLIGFAGLLLGLGMGLVITWNLEMIRAAVEGLIGYDVVPPDVYQLQQLPYDIDPMNIALISMIALVLSIGATLLPSWQASRLDPAEALRYE